MLKFPVFLCALFFSCALLAQTPLPPNVDDAFKKAGLTPAVMSAIVLPTAGGTAVFSQYADNAMNPGSAMKLVTTLIALEELGPVFRWKTQILSNSPIKNEILRGDLFIRGGADPNLSWEKFGLMLRALRYQGIRKIAGDILLDRSYFQPARADQDGAQFDATPDAYYNVVPDALMVHSNITAFQLESSAKEIRAQMLPPMSGLRLHNKLTLDKRDCAAWEAQWQTPQFKQTARHGLDVTLSGSFPRLCKTTVYLNLMDRNLYIEHLLRALWSEMGGTWNGSIRDGSTPADATVLVERQSETLADTIKLINKQSDNGMSRLLYLTLGAEATDAKNYAETAQAAQARILAWFARHQISSAGLIVENGSGLSRLERLSAAQLASLLQIGARSDWFPEFAGSLPIVAIDGSMRKRLKGSSAQGRARIKTGTLKNVAAVAGYVRDIHDTNWIVVGIINGEGASKGKAALDELISWVAAGRP